MTDDVQLAVDVLTELGVYSAGLLVTVLELGPLRSRVCLDRGHLGDRCNAITVPNTWITTDWNPEMSVCRDCHATIKFVSLDTGKVMPIDPIPHPRGNVAATGGRALTGYVLSKDKPLRDGYRTYMPHRAACDTGEPRKTAGERTPTLFDQQPI